jgi:hypothetical protein
MNTLLPGLLARLLVSVALALTGHTAAYAFATPDELAAAYLQMVRQQLHPPADEIQYYAKRAQLMLEEGGILLLQPQYVVVVDRDPNVQVILVYWISSAATPRLIGASPVSTGRVGRFDHFQTPTGIFDHSVSGGDFRAEGTKNEHGIRGYGKKGMRIYDFGWQEATRGWGQGGLSTMRLQMHATDPDILEPRLGTVQSKGCIRIPNTLNSFLDRFGVLDVEYEAAAAAGEHMWVLSPERTPVAGAGHYLLILDSGRTGRPSWSRPPS